jgi:hypothetical protein
MADIDYWFKTYSTRIGEYETKVSAHCVQFSSFIASRAFSFRTTRMTMCVSLLVINRLMK